ncbi:MAG TPA: hypothetical protein VNN74_05940 [Candidatus Micrarchaeia archaeon]|nr:hypothetical protein [Candidatus Micrarchaeia archaeon]
MTPRGPEEALAGAERVQALAVAVREARAVLRRVDRLAATCEELDDPGAAERGRTLRDAAEATLDELLRHHAAAQRRTRALVRRSP